MTGKRFIAASEKTERRIAPITHKGRLTTSGMADEKPPRPERRFAQRVRHV
ncbi:MAG: hypothetical protein LBD58_04790 [Treponema sp.]|nr:hypothetical protein [Treponema sp.]